MVCAASHKMYSTGTTGCKAFKRYIHVCMSKEKIKDTHTQEENRVAVLNQARIHSIHGPGVQCPYTDPSKTQSHHQSHYNLHSGCNQGASSPVNQTASVGVTSPYDLSAWYEHNLATLMQRRDVNSQNLPSCMELRASAHIQERCTCSTRESANNMQGPSECNDLTRHDSPKILGPLPRWQPRTSTKSPQIS